MQVHILNGDALLHNFPERIAGEKIIFREALIEGPVSEQHFIKNRASYFFMNYDVSEEEYFEKSVKELQKIKEINPNTEINLWFEDDLFCQTNLWYCIHNILKSGEHQKVFLVRPDTDSWHGFGIMDKARLEHAFKKRNLLNHEQLCSFNQLWHIYRSETRGIPNETLEALVTLIPRIKQISDAHFERLPPLQRPFKNLKRIIHESEDKSFPIIFRKFSKREGIYGFGDSTIKKWYDEIMSA